jgi:bacteriophage exclusion system BrxB-like protein
MSSLKERIELLESDLKAVPPRISVYHDLPFAILRYDPAEEWELRREVRLLATRLEGAGKEVHLIPMSELLWKAIEESEGLDEIVELERDQGFVAAQRQVTTYLSHPAWRPLAKLLSERLADLDPRRGVVFLTRAAAMSPGIYFMSKLLDEMQGKTRVTTILLYPGSIEGTTGLRFMDLNDRDALGNYRVKIYG